MLEVDYSNRDVHQNRFFSKGESWKRLIRLSKSHCLGAKIIAIFKYTVASAICKSSIAKVTRSASVWSVTSSRNVAVRRTNYIEKQQSFHSTNSNS